MDKVDGKNIKNATNFIDGYSVFGCEDADGNYSYGLIDKNGNVVVSPKYSELLLQQGGICIGVPFEYPDTASYISSNDNDVVYDILNSSGKVLCTVNSNKYNIKGVENDIIIVSKNDDGDTKYGLLYMNGDVKLKPSSKILRIKDIRGDKFLYYSGDGWGVMDTDGEIVLRAKYDNIAWASEDLLWAMDNMSDECKLIDLNGEKKSEETYKDVTYFFDDNVAFVKVGKSEWTIIDRNGKEVKGVPNIYELSLDAREGQVWSDFMDIDEIVEACKISSIGIGDFELNMVPSAMIQAYAKNSDYYYGEAVVPENWKYRDKLKYSKNVEHADLEFEVCYRGSLARMKEGYDYDYYDEAYAYEWTDEQPELIQLSISGSKVENRVEEVYAKVAEKVKSLGSILRSNSKAMIVTIGQNRGICVGCEDDRVVVVLMNTSDYKEINIDYLDGQSSVPADTIMWEAE